MIGASCLVHVTCFPVGFYGVVSPDLLLCGFDLVFLWRRWGTDAPGLLIMRFVHTSVKLKDNKKKYWFSSRIRKRRWSHRILMSATEVGRVGPLNTPPVPHPKEGSSSVGLDTITLICGSTGEIKVCVWDKIGSFIKKDCLLLYHACMGSQSLIVYLNGHAAGMHTRR